MALFLEKRQLVIVYELLQFLLVDIHKPPLLCLYVADGSNQLFVKFEYFIETESDGSAKHIPPPVLLEIEM